MTQMRNGMSLDATMLRRGIPFEVDSDSKLAQRWLQVCQRISQSENGLARWEVVAGEAAIAAEAKQAIGRIVQKFDAGPEYMG